MNTTQAPLPEKKTNIPMKSEIELCTNTLSNFNKMTIKELKHYCRQNSISNYSNKSKLKIIELILSNKTHKSSITNTSNNLINNQSLMANLVSNDMLLSKLNEKKIQELRHICKTLGINIYNKKTKQKIIESILATNDAEVADFIQNINDYNQKVRNNSNNNNNNNNNNNHNTDKNVNNASNTSSNNINDNNTIEMTTKLTVEPKFYPIDSDDDHNTNQTLNLNSAFCNNIDNTNNVKNIDNVDNVSVKSFDNNWD